MFYLTSRDAKTVRRTSWGLDTSDRYFDKEHFEIEVFVFSVTLTLTFVLFLLAHVLRMMYWNIHAKFH